MDNKNTNGKIVLQNISSVEEHHKKNSSKIKLGNGSISQLNRTILKECNEMVKYMPSSEHGRSNETAENPSDTKKGLV